MDAIKQDKNNVVGNQRIVTVITYLNEEVSNEHKGELRLYLKNNILDIVPRFGR